MKRYLKFRMLLATFLLGIAALNLAACGNFGIKTGLSEIEEAYRKFDSFETVQLLWQMEELGEADGSYDTLAYIDIAGERCASEFRMNGKLYQQSFTCGGRHYIRLPESALGWFETETADTAMAAWESLCKISFTEEAFSELKREEAEDGIRFTAELSEYALKRIKEQALAQVQHTDGADAERNMPDNGGTETALAELARERIEQTDYREGTVIFEIGADGSMNGVWYTVRLARPEIDADDTGELALGETCEAELTAVYQIQKYNEREILQQIEKRQGEAFGMTSK